MTPVSSPRANGRLVTGMIFVALGMLFLLDNFGLVAAGDVLRFWPLVLIALGLTRLFKPCRPEQRVGGVVLLFLGSAFLLEALHVPWFRIHLVWPALLVVIGGNLLWLALRSGKALPAERPGNPGEEPPPPAGRSGLAADAIFRGGAAEAGAVLREFALMGGGERVVRAQDFRGGEVTAIMGGFQIDLRGAGIAGDSATIEVFTLFGGVEFKVPPEWSVVLNGTPILGVFTNSAQLPVGGSTPAKTLILRGAAIMGGVEVKN